MLRNTWILVALMVLAGAASADDTVSARFNLGLSGEVEVDGSDDDLDTTYGFDVAYVHGLHPNFGIGGGLALLWWIGEGAPDDADRNLFVDLGIRPEARFDAGPVEVFGAGLFGLTYSTIGEDDFFGGEVESAIGYHLGLELGGRFMVRPSAGLELALAFTRHDAEHQVDTVLGNVEIDGRVNQVMLRIGGVFGLGLSR
jgi:hypothetical protein